MRKLLSLTVLASLLSACAAKYSDVSTDDDVSSLVGTTCVTQVVLKEHGFTALNAPHGELSEYSLTPEPGFSGRYVVTKRDVPPGTTLTIKSVRLCGNCLDVGAGRLDLEVEYERALPKPAYLTGTFGDVDVLQRKESRYALNPDICR